MMHRHRSGTPVPSSPAGRWGAGALLAILGILLLSSSAGCGGDGDGGVRPDPVAEFRFVPPAGAFELPADLSVRFSVTDADGRPVVAVFTVDGDTVAVGAQFDFVPARLGDVVVVARVGADGGAASATWEIRVTDDEVLPTPEVFELGGEPGPLPGTIALQWERPPPSLVPIPIVAYEIAAHTAGFDDADFANHLILTQADSPNIVRQRATLNDLEERVLHTVRVRAVDAVGRASTSRSFESEATGQYAWSGTVYAFPRVPGPSRLSVGVIVDVGTRRGFTGIDGRFELAGIPDLTRQSLRLNEQTGATFYEIDTGLLPMVDRDFRLLLLPRGLVELVGASAITYPGGFVERLRFLRIMREMDFGGASFDFPTWAQYPVKVYVHPFVQDARGEVFGGRPGELVDLAQSFRVGVEAWNRVSGADLLELVEIDQPLDPSVYPSITGAFYDTSLSDTQQILGRVEFERPRPGTLYRTVPELLRVKLRSEFNFQDVADWVVTHELGHVLGLAHSPSRSHIMLATSSPSTEQTREPHAEEGLIARLLRDLSIYGPDMRSDWYGIPD